MNKRKRESSIIWICIMGIFLISILFQSPAFVSAQDIEGQQVAMRQGNENSIALDNLERFLENWTEEQIVETPLYGFGFVMVKDGEIFLAKSYGTDPLTNIPFDAETATFRVASVAKLFTATAIMQLHDQGLINLHDDVNEYLTTIQLEDDFSEPITFHHLLTHTEGFERWVIGIRPQNFDEFISLQEFYTTRQAKRIFPPGQLMTYDNYTSGLLGLLVEEISGMPFTDYIAENIFAPLDMGSSTFVQPPPDDIHARVLTEYEYDEDTGEYIVIPERISILSPAGGMHTNLIDMGHYLVAMLGNGSYKGGQIMGEETIQQMFLQQFAAHPQMPGMTYGLFEDFPNGQRVLRRDGDSMNAWSRVYLLPDEQTGLFFVAIGDEHSRIQFAEAFFDEFYPRSKEQLAPPTPSDLRKYRGAYHHVHHSRSTFAKTLALFTGNIRVTPFGNSLSVSVMDMGDSFGGFEETTQWEKAGENFFQRKDGSGNIAFTENEDGEITHLYSGQRYMGAYAKLSWYENPVFHYILMGIFAVVFLSALPLALKLSYKLGAIAAGATGITGFLFIALWIPGIYLIGTIGGEPALAYGVNMLTKVILTLPLITVLFVPILIFAVWQIWSDTAYVLGQQLHCALILVTAFGFIAWTHYWNLLGFRY